MQVTSFAFFSEPSWSTTSQHTRLPRPVYRSELCQRAHWCTSIPAHYLSVWSSLSPQQHLSQMARLGLLLLSLLAGTSAIGPAPSKTFMPAKLWCSCF